MVLGRFQIHCPPGPTGLRDTADGWRQELRTRAESPRGSATARGRGPAAAPSTRFLVAATKAKLNENRKWTKYTSTLGSFSSCQA